jgi:hypothetical protein
MLRDGLCVDKESMGEGHERFVNLKKNNELVDASEPAKVMTNLVLNGKGDEISGGYFRYDDKQLAEFA